MKNTESKLREALRGFMRAAETREGDLAGALRRLEELQTQLGPDAPPMLRHYLQRRSYAKALALLETGRPEDETPRCK